MPVALHEVVSYLDQYLRIAEVSDSPNALNGLQVENRGTVSRIAAAVDACQATIDAAVERQADMLLTHHGLFWSGLEPLTGRHARRVRRLLEGNVALYSAHIPLDVHPEVGNNVLLAGKVGLKSAIPFGDYHGEAIGLIGSIDLTLDELVALIGETLGLEPHVIATGPDRVSRLGVVTGGGGNMIRQAVEAGADTFVTGEGNHHTYFDAEEWGINVIYAGHYATETLGVQALARHLEERFGTPSLFIDHPTGL
jgi:dinuclear metal center YbgI/SA1388 family protein